MRKLLIAANWKMHKTPIESTAFLTSFFPLIKNNTTAEIVLCPAMTCLPALVDAARSRPVFIGAQNMHWESSGAWTGEISAPMLAEAGCRYVELAHSERLQHFGETYELVRRKLNAAIAHSLTPILCLGETAEDKQRGASDSVLIEQMSVALADQPALYAAAVILAYEPRWAIGALSLAESM